MLVERFLTKEMQHEMMHRLHSLKENENLIMLELTYKIFLSAYNNAVSDPALEENDLSKLMNEILIRKN